MHALHDNESGCGGDAMDHVNFLLLGLGNGAVYAALGLAIALTYRSSGVLNFATGSIAIYAAYTYAFLRKGVFFQPIPGLPSQTELSAPLAFLPAFAISVALSALVGIVLYLVVFRQMRAATATSKAVASLGVMVLITGLLGRAIQVEAVLVRPIFPQKAYTFGDVRIIGDRVWFCVTIIGIALCLAALYRFTRFGLATRAAAETEVGALVSGLRPERIALINWAISAAVAGAAGIFISPLVPLLPSTYTLFVVPALAAAVLGRFTALTPVVLGGIAIGMLQSEAVFIHNKVSWTFATGNNELVPLILVLVVLLVKSDALPTRGTLMEKSMGKSPRPHNMVVPIVAGTAIGAIALLVTEHSIRGAVVLSMIMAIIALSQVVVTGYAGQLSLAQLTLAGVGGFLLSRFTEGMNIPFPIAPVLAAVGAMIIGVIIGLPALRLRGLLVGVVTLTLAVALEAVWFRNGDLNGGGQSGAPIKSATFLGVDLDVGSGLSYPKLAYCFMVLTILVLVATGVAILRNSRLGAAMLAVRANERSAAAAGISVTQVKVLAFAIGAFIAGLGGALMAYKDMSVTFGSYTAIAGLGLAAMVFVAGITSIYGGITAGIIAEGGIIFVLIDRNVHVGSWYAIISGLGLIFNVMLNPQGVVAPGHQFMERLRLRKAGQRQVSEIKTASVGTTARHSGTRGDVLLHVENLTVRYGGVTAVDNVTLDVHQGLIVGLIGPNGAGKTTSIDAISGFTSYSGRVLLNDLALDEFKPHQRIAKGLGRTFQGVDLYEDLTVTENIAVSQHVTGESIAEAGQSLAALLKMLDLERVRDRGVGELSQGERQLVSIARALATKPKLLLLDEPAAGLDSSESLWLADRLREIRDSGVTILMVDHDMGLVLGLCDEIHVLDFGRLIATGTPAEIRANPTVSAAYLGASVEGHS